MKALGNWRNWIKTILFTIGFLFLLRAFGESIEPISLLEWFKQLFISLSASALCFYALHKLTKYWEGNGMCLNKPTKTQ